MKLPSRIIYTPGWFLILVTPLTTINFVDLLVRRVVSLPGTHFSNALQLPWYRCSLTPSPMTATTSTTTTPSSTFLPALPPCARAFIDTRIVVVLYVICVHHVLHIITTCNSTYLLIPYVVKSSVLVLYRFFGRGP